MQISQTNDIAKYILTDHKKGKYWKMYHCIFLKDIRHMTYMTVDISKYSIGYHKIGSHLSFPLFPALISGSPAAYLSGSLRHLAFSLHSSFSCKYGCPCWCWSCLCYCWKRYPFSGLQSLCPRCPVPQSSSAPPHRRRPRPRPQQQPEVSAWIIRKWQRNKKQKNVNIMQMQHSGCSLNDWQGEDEH